jgi:gamma-glutamyltranspeptidase/glutathione hydrolase
MAKAAGFKEAFLLKDKVPDVGAVLKQTAFAATLEHLARAGLDDFYRGDIGREISADLDRIGSPVTRGDLESFRAIVDEPLSVATRAGTVYNSPPPTQGLASVIILALFDRLRVAQAESFEHVHGIVEATKRAFRVRDRVVTDPDKVTADLNQYLSPAFLDADAARIDARKAARWPAPKGEGIRYGWAADASGLVVSYISRFTGIRLGCCCGDHRDAESRRQFSLDPKALNTLEPDVGHSTRSIRHLPF